MEASTIPCSPNIESSSSLGSCLHTSELLLTLNFLGLAIHERGPGFLATAWKHVGVCSKLIPRTPRTKVKETT
jgi:hypothetical protein